MRIAAAQASARAGDLAHNVATAARLVRRAEARLVVLPEAFLTGYDAATFAGALPTPDDLTGALLDPLRAAAEATGATVVASSAVLRPEGRTLSSVVVEPDGRVDLPYDKQHLFEDERRWFVAGERDSGLLVDEVRCGLSICYDGDFPAHAADAVAAGARAYLASVAYFAGGADKVHAMYATRARENAVPVVVAGLTGWCGEREFAGGSAVYGPDGTALTRLGAEEGVAVAELGFVTSELGVSTTES